MDLSIDNFPVVPSLPSRFICRPYKSDDLIPCAKLIADAFCYHNPLDSTLKLPSHSYQPAVEVFLQTAQVEGHSFVIEDSLFDDSFKCPLCPKASEGAESEQKNESKIISCVISHDAFHQPDWAKARKLSKGREKMSSVYVRLGFLSDEKKKKKQILDEKITEANKQFDCFFLATNHHYNKQHHGVSFVSYLSLISLYHSIKKNFKKFSIVCTHPATNKIFTAQTKSYNLNEIIKRLKFSVECSVRPSELIFRQSLFDQAVALATTLNNDNSQNNTNENNNQQNNNSYNNNNEINNTNNTNTHTNTTTNTRASVPGAIWPGDPLYETYLEALASRDSPYPDLERPFSHIDYDVCSFKLQINAD